MTTPKTITVTRTRTLTLGIETVVMQYHRFPDDELPDFTEWLLEAVADGDLDYLAEIGDDTATDTITVTMNDGTTVTSEVDGNYGVSSELAAIVTEHVLGEVFGDES